MEAHLGKKQKTLPAEMKAEKGEKVYSDMNSFDVLMNRTLTVFAESENKGIWYRIDITEILRSIMTVLKDHEEKLSKPADSMVE